MAGGAARLLQRRRLRRRRAARDGAASPVASGAAQFSTRRLPRVARRGGQRRRQPCARARVGGQRCAAGRGDARLRRGALPRRRRPGDALGRARRCSSWARRSCAQKPYKYDNIARQQGGPARRAGRSGRADVPLLPGPDPPPPRQPAPSASHDLDVIHVARRQSRDRLHAPAGQQRTARRRQPEQPPVRNGYVIQTDAASRCPTARWQETFNSDAAIYGGGNIGNFGMAVAAGHGRIEVRDPGQRNAGLPETLSPPAMPDSRRLTRSRASSDTPPRPAAGSDVRSLRSETRSWCFLDEE